MSEKVKELYKKIHNNKNDIPFYASIIVRPGKKLTDIKIKKEDVNMLRIIAHEEKGKGWFVHSFHIPLKNLGASPDMKDKDILSFLTNPNKIANKPTKSFVEDLLRKYTDILPNSGRYFFKTERYKKKKEFQTGVKLKGF